MPAALRPPLCSLSDAHGIRALDASMHVVTLAE